MEQRKLKVAHFGQFGPNQAGIHTTAMEMIMAERLVGIDSQYIDFDGKKNKPSRVGLTDGSVTTVGPSFAEKADILVRHSAIPWQFLGKYKPIVMCIHGRPEYTFLLEYYGRVGLIQEYLKCGKNPQYKSFITFWKEHIPFLEWLLPDAKIDFVPAMVDLDKYNPVGMKAVLAPNEGKPNIVIADNFRTDTTPFNVLMAAALFVKLYCPKGRVHIFGLQKSNQSPVKDMADMLKRANILGKSTSLVRNIEQVYRAAEIVVTPQVIATRVVREALASGVPLVAGKGNPYTRYTANPRDTRGFASEINKCWRDIKKGKQRTNPREVAEEHFNLEQAGQKALEVYERIMTEQRTNQKSAKVEVLKGPRIFNFIPYDTEENVGRAYNHYMELIEDDDWACFIDHDAMFTTPDWFKQIQKVIAANPEYGCLSAIANRVGNPAQKVANLQDTHDILYHRKIGKLIQQQQGTKVNDATNTHCISGVVILVKKSVWKKAGGFADGFLGVDNDFHTRVVKAGEKVGVMRGLYLYHFYRAADSKYKPILT